jgi:sirohydrochlorin cobaltochelatase
LTRGLVLFAHGARDPQWSAPLRDLAQRIEALKPDVRVRIAFLEIAPPTLTDAVAALSAACTRIDILPVFWAPAGHVNNELPALVEACHAAHPQIAFNVLPTLSELPGLLDFVARQAIALSARDTDAFTASRTSPPR